MISKIAKLLALFVLGSCGGTGSEPPELYSANGLGGDRGEVSGTLQNSTGAQDQREGWILAAVDFHGVSELTRVDAGGNFKFQAVLKNLPVTFVLLSPEHSVRSPLAFRLSSDTTTLTSFVKVHSNKLPPLIDKGNYLTLDHLTGVTAVTDFNVKDENTDQIPDGMASYSLADSESPAVLDTDKDGVLNVFDDDDNDDGTPDMADAASLTNDAHTTYIYKWVGVQFLTQVKDDGTTEYYLQFRCEPRSDLGGRTLELVLPSSLVQTSLSLLGSSTVSLKDDGNSGDVAADDGIYGARIQLTSATAVSGHQVYLFAASETRSSGKLSLGVFATLPSVTVSTINGSIDTTQHTFTLVGSPFGDATGFKWNVNIYSSDGSLLFESPKKPGTETSLTLPSSLFVSGQTYSYTLEAGYGEKVENFSSFVVRSAKTSFTW